MNESVINQFHFLLDLRNLLTWFDAVDSEIHRAHSGTLILGYADLAGFQRARLVSVALVTNYLQQISEMWTHLGGRSSRTTLRVYGCQTDNFQCAHLTSQYFGFSCYPSFLYKQQTRTYIIPQDHIRSVDNKHNGR